ncbi:restriction endonuclease subunit S [Bremerella sp. JC817]|uniref:restriction endonuclease subunit S n=1 Tax=Bremerella sp. JC817 TaxID=3231756 RepID=UPI0034589A1F
MRIQDICEVVRGSSPRPKGDSRFYGGPVPRLMVADVTRDGMYVTPRIDSLTEEGAARSRPMRAGDVVIAVSGAPGLPAILTTDACIHDGFVGLRNLDLGRVFPAFLYRYLDFVKTRSGSGAVGAIFKNLTTDQIRDLEIPVLPLSEQKRIADILDKADAIRRKRQEAIDQFGALTESLFHEMFSHKLSSVQWTDLSDYLVELRYGTSNKSGEGGYTTLRIPNIVRGIIDLTDLKTVDASDNELEKLKLLEGDVLFVRTNGNPDYVGRCAVFAPSQMNAAGLDSDEIIYASYLIRARLHLDRLRPLFLQSLLQTPAGRRNVREKCRTSAGQYNINTKGIGALRIPDVSIAEQMEFEKRVESFSSVLASLTTAHSETDDLFNSLVQLAFKGEL